MHKTCKYLKMENVIKLKSKAFSAILLHLNCSDFYKIVFMYFLSGIFQNYFVAPLTIVWIQLKIAKRTEGMLHTQNEHTTNKMENVEKDESDFQHYEKSRSRKRFIHSMQFTERKTEIHDSTNAYAKKKNGREGELNEKEGWSIIQKNRKYAPLRM